MIYFKSQPNHLPVEIHVLQNLNTIESKSEKNVEWNLPEKNSGKIKKTEQNQHVATSADNVMFLVVFFSVVVFLSISMLASEYV